jgi:hypothetical protein
MARVAMAAAAVLQPDPAGVEPAARSRLLTRGVRGDAGERDEALGEALPAVDPARTGEVVAEGGMGGARGVGTNEGHGMSSWASSPK